MKKITHPMPIACLDYESCFAPELWPSVAEAFDIEELYITTKEEPDFDALMNKRLAILEGHGKTLEDVRAVAATHEPLEGAPEFLDWLRSKMPAVLISDMVYQLAEPMIEKLGYPTMLSTYIYHDENGKMVYNSRIEDRKASSVRALKSLNYYTIGMGDSLNDIGLLEEADTAMLYRPNEAMRQRFPDMDVFNDLASVRQALEEHVEVIQERDVVAAR